ncbi:hypothetical protein OIU84_029008 [Salix udensis]|uniref:Glucose/Sorbosone dehydrogenase domain-containing protein n=1 Tax=Salix udensis TaxID=889485 RepID=A0AAD6KDU8_9ROSI|nr:hypothetical protein OIU84_029008 [Salix udensis]
MDGIPSVIFFFFFCNILLLTRYGSAYPLCTDSRSPFIPKSPHAFCQYSGRGCCNSTEDVELRKQFKSLNVSGYGCASLLKSTICSRCDPFSAELYRIGSGPRVVPVLCNSTVLANSSQSHLAATDFCSKVWDECHNLSISNSPFTKDKAGSVVNSSSRLTELWESKGAFCDEFGGASGDGSGKIWLATVPAEGSGETLGIDVSNPFLDLTDEVYYDTELGMMGIAFHPNFQQNGRFFASFNCDKVKWPECSGRCSCNSHMGCDPSKLPSENGAQPCQYHSIIAEFSANGTSSQPSQATSVQPLEVRRIFTMGLPFAAHHGGQILFGPEDGYLYFMMGDGGSIGDPYNFSQNKKSLLGKIMRLDIDNIPRELQIEFSVSGSTSSTGGQTITDRGLWGNYSVPGDNPFSEDEGLEPEIWALGLRNPWRCTFDADRPSYFLCADVGQDEYEEVDLITKGW